MGGAPYPSTLGAFGAIVREEGVAGLWRGTGVCMARAVGWTQQRLATSSTIFKTLVS